MRITADIIDEEIVSGCASEDKVSQSESSQELNKLTEDEKKTMINPSVTHAEVADIKKEYGFKMQHAERVYGSLSKNKMTFKYCKPPDYCRRQRTSELSKRIIPSCSEIRSRYLTRYAAADTAYAASLSKLQTLRMRDMCNRFRDLKLSGDPALLENVKKSCDYAQMACKTKYKMDEAKANNSKSTMDLETPPAWMIEFLLKMKQEIKDEIMEELSNLPRIEMLGQSSNGKDENPQQGDVIHPGIFCDNCDQVIHGIRYKCGNCSDFDLCQECECLPNIHNKNHIFLKIRYPVALKLYQKQKGQPLIIPNAGDILASNSKMSNHQSKRMYEARFLWDETIPDGTVVAPSTRFVKSWRVGNCGKRVWTHSTKLQHIQGSAGLIPASEQVDVPHLRPGEEGVVSVLFTTPSVPGVYRSHWNFCHKSRPFGHIVWCHIIVEEPEKHAENACQTLQLPADGLPDEKEQEVASIAQVLTAVKEEHERGNMIPRKLAVNSHTATPNNTPFDLTPPKSPDHQVMNELKEISEDKESINSKQNAELDAEDDGSVVSLSSSESDAEFVVIPMPKCFNLSESFSSQHIPDLSQYLQSETVGDLNASVQKLVKPQAIIAKHAINSETVSQETGVPELSMLSELQKETEQKILISHNVSADGSSSEISIIESGGSSPTDEHVMPEISSIRIAVTSDMKPETNQVTNESNQVTGDGNVQKVEDIEKEETHSDAQPSSATFPKFPVEGITSIYEPASSNTNTEERTVQVLPERLVNAPLNAAATIYKTARDVISSFQQGGSYGRSGSASAPLNPMDQLAEMGFCNKPQNEELLRKHKNDVALVVAELVSLNDNDWYASRHVPPSPPDYFD